MSKKGNRMTEPERESFSKKWMLASMAIFVGVELFLGGLIGDVVVGRFMSLSLRFILQGALNLVSYFVGGFIIGFVSPGVRTFEPAAGAFLSVALMLCLSFFTPYGFIRFSMMKMVIGGAIAFFLALAGARLGERVAGNRV